MVTKTVKLYRGAYVFRGYKIIKHPSDRLLPGRKWIWEIEDPSGSVFNHTPTLRLAKALIDEKELSEITGA